MAVRIIGRHVLAVFIGLLLMCGNSKANDIIKSNNKAAKALQDCLAIKSNKQRLICYDQIARKFSPPKFKGRLGMVTKPFRLDRPHRLRFRSYGVIFVLYLRNVQETVLQNLHIGGGGEDHYLIEQPGVYSLKIHGSAGWEIWLEPVATIAQKKESEKK